MFLHAVFGGVYLAFAGFQFVGRVRSGHPVNHRRMVRVLVWVGLVVGVTGLFIGLVMPFNGWIGRVYIGVFGTLFVVAVVKGFLHIRTGRVALYREWMVRAFAVALAIATVRVLFVPAIAIAGDLSDAPLRDPIVPPAGLILSHAFIVAGASVEFL